MSEETINDSGIGIGKSFHGSDTETDTSKILESESFRATPSRSREVRIFLVNNTAENNEIAEACRLFEVPVYKKVVSTIKDLEFEVSPELLSVFIVDSLDDCPSSATRNGQNHLFLGCTAFLEIANKEKKREEMNDGSIFEELLFRSVQLGKSNRIKKVSKPLYCHSLYGKVICFTGFREEDADDVFTLSNRVKFMGGEVSKDAGCQVTHLVAKKWKYKKLEDKCAYAACFNIPVVTKTWIKDAWENRNILHFDAADPDFVAKYRFKLFSNCRVCFLGYADDEKLHMTEVLRENGGEPVSLTDDSCTHVVVDSTRINAAPPVKHHVYVVRAEWFWASIQFEYRQNELNFKLGDTNQQGNNTPSALSNNSLYISSSGRKRKRKRFRDRHLINGESSPQSAQKRRSSVSDLTRLSGGSLLDYTSSTIADDSEYSVSEKPKSSERYRRFLELWQTETNYVGILRTIMTVFKAELESMIDDKKGAELLNATEIKNIFGNLPPIYTTHCKMLDELNEMKANWSEESSVGSLILKYSPDLMKAYPPFINFFEKTREMLNECDRTKPRFHAFLKLCQSKPECGRQGLQDLLIRPVQRLPSIYLLLKDILKDTQKNSFDHGKLEIAMDELQKVMNYINEDKRRTEGQVVLFDIYNQIEKCPADLVSSHRCFIKKCEATDLNEELCGKKSLLVLFLFSDRIEVCKKRTKASNKENSSSRHGNDKLKHVESIRLSSVTKVIDVKEAEDCHNIFGIELNDSERVFYFAITDLAISKEEYLHLLCNEILNVACRTDIESVLIELEPQQFKNDSNNVATGVFEKAFNKFASKTRKVSRALSFRALLTPKKAESAMSLVSPFGIQNASTPSSPFANLRLAALPPVPNYSENDSVMSTPTSTQQLRKTKSTSFNMGSLRRL